VQSGTLTTEEEYVVDDGKGDGDKGWYDTERVTGRREIKTYSEGDIFGTTVVVTGGRWRYDVVVTSPTAVVQYFEMTAEGLSGLSVLPQQLQSKLIALR